MQKKHLLLLSAAAMALLTACSGKLGALSADNFNVDPNPLAASRGEVPATINGIFPEKYMKKKAVVTVTPELRFTENGVPTTAQAKTGSAAFQGEQVMGNDQTISYRLGGHYTMKTAFDYRPAMQKSDLWLTFKAYVGKKEVKVPAVKVAEGVIATSELYHRTLTSAQPCLAEDAFQRVTEQKQEANIKFLIQQANLRQSELKTGSVQEFVSLLKRISADREGLNLSNVEVSAYASPDGGLQLNERLAGQRQDNTEKYVAQQMKAANLNSPIDTRYTAQDWEGFQELVRASNLQDKEVILRVLSMYKDPEEREQQVKNISIAFRELADGILPELRRARMTINYETIGRDDEQIEQQLAQDATKLSVEEILYAATLTEDATRQEDIYLKAAQLFPNDARAYNNIAMLEYQRGNYAEAQRYLERARQADSSCAEVNANLGLLALQQGNTALAEDYIGRAADANGLAEVLGNLHLAQGNYALAAQDFNNVNSNSAALAQLLNGDYARATQTLASISRPDGLTAYLQAIANARQGNTEQARQALQTALQLDPSLSEYAANDLELAKVKR